MDVVLDELGEFSAEFEVDAFFGQAADDGFVGVWDEGLEGGVELEEREFGVGGVGAEDGGGCTVAKEGCADEVVGAVGGGRAEADDGCFGGGEEDSAAWVVLCNVLQ